MFSRDGAHSVALIEIDYRIDAYIFIFLKKKNKKKDVDLSKPHLFLQLRCLMGKPV